MWASSGFQTEGNYIFKPFAVCNNERWPGAWQYGKLTADIANTDCDWGVFNAILNGGNEPNIWRTMTRPEWEYLLNERDNAVNLRGLGKVAITYGLILLPDDWTLPDGCSFTPLSNKVLENNADKPTSLLNWTVYSDEQWAVLEANGAVFLPAAGREDPGNNNVDYASKNEISSSVTYWTSSYAEDRNYAWALDLGQTSNTNNGTNWRFDKSSRAFGRAVRLVRDVE